MPTIPINDLQPGMVLENDAVHSNGRVLLRGGVTLEHKHIRMFKTWGLLSAEITGVTQDQLESEALSNLDQTILDAVQKELSSRFRHTDVSHPMIGELYRVLVRLRARQKHKDRHNEVDN